MHAPLAVEHGTASTQVVLVTPAVLLVIAMVFQFALYAHASHVVTAAAQHGAAAASVEGGGAAEGRSRALEVIGRSDRGLLRGPEVETSRDGNRSRVVVRAGVVSLLPGISLSVSGVADGPTERFRSRTER